MELVMDANILFSALIKDGTTARLLFEPALKLYVPEFIIEEFGKYEDIILKKTSRTRQEFAYIMGAIKEVVVVIPEEEYSEYVDEARVASPDENDVMYLALALKLKCSIWSNDKKLKNQNKVDVYSTVDLMKII
jgi:predicted nucleic acid-binding protein